MDTDMDSFKMHFYIYIQVILSYLMLFLQQYSLSNSGNCGYTFTTNTGVKDRLAHYRMPDCKVL